VRALVIYSALQLRIAGTLLIDAHGDAALDQRRAHHRLERDRHVERRLADANEKQTPTFGAIRQCEASVLAHHQRVAVDAQQTQQRRTREHRGQAGIENVNTMRSSHTAR